MPTVHGEAGWGCRRRNKKTKAPRSIKGPSKEAQLEPFHAVPHKFYLPPILCYTCWSRAGISTLYSAKGKIANIFIFMGHIVFITVTQLHCHSTKAATDKMNMNGCGCVPIKLYLQKQVVGQIWCQGHSLPIPGLGSGGSSSSHSQQTASSKKLNWD